MGGATCLEGSNPSLSVPDAHRLAASSGCSRALHASHPSSLPGGRPETEREGLHPPRSLKVCGVVGVLACVARVAPLFLARRAPRNGEGGISSLPVRSNVWRRRRGARVRCTRRTPLPCQAGAPKRRGRDFIPPCSLKRLAASLGYSRAVHASHPSSLPGGRPETEREGFHPTLPFRQYARNAAGDPAIVARYWAGDVAGECRGSPAHARRVQPRRRRRRDRDVRRPLRGQRAAGDARQPSSGLPRTRRHPRVDGKSARGRRGSFRGAELHDEAAMSSSPNWPPTVWDKPAGCAVEWTTFAVLHMRDGKIVRVQAFLTKDAAVEAAEPRE